MSLNEIKTNAVNHAVSLKQEDQLKKNKKIRNKDKKQGKIKKSLIGSDHRTMFVNSILFMLFTTIIGTCLLYYVNVNLKDLKNDIKVDYNISDTEIIVNTKKYVDAISTAKLKDMSNDITKSIYNTLDMDQLKSELDQGIISPELDIIFRNNIQNKCSVPGLDKDINNIFICNSKGILADYSNIYATDTEGTRTWEVESTRQQNLELFNNSIQSMLKQDITVMFVEESVLDENNSEHKIVTKMTETELVDIVKTEGLEGIKNYTFLVPVYIMENNDIFGANDIVNGHRVQNNKFIIVQRYNLYNYIKLYNINKEFDHESIDNKFDLVFILIYIFIIFYILSIVTFIIYAIIIVNKGIDEDSNNAKNFNVNRKVNSINDIDPYAMTGRRAYDKYSAEIIRLLQEERRKSEEEKEKEKKAAEYHIYKDKEKDLEAAAEID